MIVSKYWLPNLAFGNGPTQSINTLLKGSSTAGMGLKGALGGCRLGLPTIWQVWHTLQNLQHLYVSQTNKNVKGPSGMFCLYQGGLLRAKSMPNAIYHYNNMKAP